jgi:hypothetical protein
VSLSESGLGKAPAIEDRQAEGLEAGGISLKEDLPTEGNADPGRLQPGAAKMGF